MLCFKLTVLSAGGFIVAIELIDHGIHKRGGAGFYYIGADSGGGPEGNAVGAFHQHAHLRGGGHGGIQHAHLEIGKAHLRNGGIEDGQRTAHCLIQRVHGAQPLGGGHFALTVYGYFDHGGGACCGIRRHLLLHYLEKLKAEIILKQTLCTKGQQLEGGIGAVKAVAVMLQLLNGGGKVLRQLPTPFEGYADVLARLGYPVKVEFDSIFPPDGGDMSLIAQRVEPKGEGERWYGIAPFAAHRGKVYDPERMERVVELLLERDPRCRVFLFGGGQEERQTLDAWERRHDRCVCASTLLSGLYQELVLMSHLDTMVSMDSANMHLASLTGTRVVSVWGATHPLAGFTGWNQKPSDAVQLDLPCRPCSIYGNKPCLRGDYACLTGIAPEAIADKVMEG